jgi:hypothetical protein
MNGQPTHKYFMNHYVAIAAVNYASDEIYRTNDPQELLETLKAKYARTLNKSQVYGVFCYDEEKQIWHGFDYDAAVDYLENLLQTK